MKKIYLLLIVSLFFTFRSFSQSAEAPTAIENKITDALCDCVSKLDFSKITSKQEAIAAYTNCIAEHTDLFSQLAAERKLDVTDKEAMKQLGLVIAKNLIAKNCTAFTKLSLLTVKKDNGGDINSEQGLFKRIDTKGFNYIVITDAKGSERSFIWLRQFPGSEQFMGLTTKLAGKKLKVTWQEMEVYLPAAKGYYKVKEIVGVDVL